MKNKQFIMKNRIPVLMLMFSIMFTSFSQNKDCKYKLVLENSVNSKTTNDIGVSYRMYLHNMEDTPIIYTLSFDTIILDSKQTNIEMNTRFFEYKSNSSQPHGFVKKGDRKYQVRLGAGKKFHFMIELLNPKEFAEGSVNTTEVKAVSQKCNQVPLSLFLNTKVSKLGIMKNY